MDKNIVYFISPKAAYILIIWHEAVKLNVPEAQFELAMFYSAVKSESAASKAVLWFKKAAKQGHAEAQYILGRCCESGHGVKRSYTQAIRQYKKAYTQAYNDLWKYPDPAAEAFEKYIQNNGWEAIDEMVEAEWESEEESFLSDEMAAELGDAKTQQSLGNRYYFGRGVEQDYEKAIYWFHESAEQGYEPAMGRLAECYEVGKGVEKSYKEAAKWYRKYAEEGIKYRNKRRLLAEMIEGRE